jgi:hypothetical protein
VFRKGGVLVGGDELPHDLGIFPRPESRRPYSTVPKFRQSPPPNITVTQTSSWFSLNGEKSVLGFSRWNCMGGSWRASTTHFLAVQLAQLMV